MMRMPDALPLHLMLAMMQSQISPNAYALWSNSFAPFLPEWMRPKSPLEQAADQLQNLMRDATAPWEKLSEQLLSQNPFLNPSAPPKENNPQAHAASHSNGFDPAYFAEVMKDFFHPEFMDALSSKAYHHSTGFLQGMQAYLASDYERPAKEYPVLWQRGSAQLFDLAPRATEGVAVLLVPSLINRSTILDLYPEVSFAEFLKARGFRPLLLDWGSPNADECEFSTADYISFYALDALEAVRAQHDGPIALLGYCMGGIFTVAMAQLASRMVDALVLLATPWDFSAPDTPTVLLAPPTQIMLRNWIATQNPVPPMVSQTVFHLIDPWRVQEKFSRYPTLSEAEKQHFLAVEQWVNDGVPLAARVAEECFVDWPQGNVLARHQWKIGRRWIEPELIPCPTLAVVPTKDAIVPKGCATPLTKLIPRCETLFPECGHVSMVVGKHARQQMWEPVANWLDAKF